MKSDTFFVNIYQTFNKIVFQNIISIFLNKPIMFEILISTKNLNNSNCVFV